MDFSKLKLKAWIVVDKEGNNLKDEIKNDPFSRILVEGNLDYNFDTKTNRYQTYPFYIDKQLADDFRDWWQGNCGEIAETREIEITIK